MRLRTGREERRIAGTLRKTQFITTAGCGAVVDLPHDSVIIAGTDYWKHYDDPKYWIEEVNLQSMLGVERFVSPKTEEKIPGNPYFKSHDMPAFRFPEMLMCPKCGRVAHYRKFAFGTKKPKCPACNKGLIPSRFVVACENGHLDDFPFSWWVHRGDFGNCKNPDDLVIFYDKKSGGLESIKVMCKSCQPKPKVRSMEGSFSRNALAGWQCTRKRPWMGQGDGANDSEECAEVARTLQRGASNLYFSVNISALSIPPWSNRIQEELSKYWSILKDTPEGMIELAISSYGLEDKCRCSKEEIKKQIKLRKESLNNSSEKSYEDIYEDEYRVLSDGEYDDMEFKTQETEVPAFLKKFINKIVLVKRLKEVMVLRGFTRIEPPVDIEDAKIVRLGRKIEKWLPAIELRGEGLFVQFNEDVLEHWANYNKERYSNMRRNMEKAGIARSNFSPEYVALHTFSHMIIRQLVMECGYSGSALKERIYCTYKEKDDAIKMAGVLIYTASPDSDGSLGGLVRQGESKNFAQVFRNMLEEAMWCSSDPLCIQSTNQGLYSLNYAACHSCALLPETCCEARNCLLDRAALVGTLDKRDIGLLSELIANSEVLT